MSSCLLFYGPGAHEAALTEAKRLGRLLADLGGDSLKVEASREAADLMAHPPAGDGIGCVVIGPLDNATPQASDVLLKPCEEFAGDIVQPILWADDLGGVIETIRSRCLPYWVNNPTPEDEALHAAATDLVGAYLTRSYWRIPTLVKANSKKGYALLQAVAAVIQGHQDSRVLDLWAQVRLVAERRNPTDIEIVAAFLG